MKSPAVIITGANGGIGKALCQVFKDAGYYVVGTDKSKSNLSCVDVYIHADLELLVSDEGSRCEFVDAVSKCIEGYPLKGLINNAALQKLGGLGSLALEDFQATMSVNVAAPLLLSKLFLAQLESVSGSIVNIGSIHAKLTKPEFISYATSKAALLGLTQALAVDLGGKVRVNIIQPAATETEMLVEGFKGNKKAFQQLKSFHPAQRIATPEEVAEAALFLVSDRCTFMTGAVLNIDGGIGCRLHDPD